jgi:hypothetical protein
LYADEVTGGYARLTTTDNSFTNNNTFGGSNTIISSTATAINSPLTVKGAQTTNILEAQMVIKNSVTPSPNSINFACALSGGNYNGIVETGDSAIISGKDVGTSNLVLTAHSTTPVGVRITGAGEVEITGSTSINGSFSGTLPMRTTYTTNPTLTENHIGFSIKQGAYTVNAGTANTNYNLYSISFPSLGVWIVNAQIFVNTAIANSYYRLSLSAVSLTHDYRNLVTGYAHYTSETDDIGVATMAVDSFTTSSALYIVASSNKNQFTDTYPPYLRTYNVSYTITKVG